MTYYPMPRMRNTRPLATRGRALRAPVVQRYQPLTRRRLTGTPGPLMMLGGDTDPCLQAGYAAEGQFQSAWTQMDQAWGNTTGIYTIDDFQTIYQAAYKFIGQAQDMLDQHRSAYGDTGPDYVISRLDDAQSQLFDSAKAGLDFGAALANAVQSNASLVNAPGFKSWVANAMISAGTAAFVVAYTNACEPAYAQTIITVLRSLITLGNDLLSLIKRAASVAANVAVTAADVVYKTTVGTLSLVASVIKYLPWIAAGVGGLWLWKEYGGGKRT